jgi:hypothetical protein
MRTGGSSAIFFFWTTLRRLIGRRSLITTLTEAFEELLALAFAINRTAG